MLVYICIDLITDFSPSFQDCYKRSRTQSLKLSSWARLTRCTNFPFGCAGRDVQQFCSTDANKVRGKGSAGTAEVGNAPLDVMRFVAVFVRMKAGMGLEDPWIPTCRKGIPKIRCLHLRDALCAPQRQRSILPSCSLQLLTHGLGTASCIHAWATDHPGDALGNYFRLHQQIKRSMSGTWRLCGAKWEQLLLLLPQPFSSARIAPHVSWCCGSSEDLCGSWAKSCPAALRTRMVSTYY